MKALVGAFNKEKAPGRSFSGHCETSQRFVDSSSVLAAAVTQSLGGAARRESGSWAERRMLGPAVRGAEVPSPALPAQSGPGPAPEHIPDQPCTAAPAPLQHHLQTCSMAGRGRAGPGGGAAKQSAQATGPRSRAAAAAVTSEQPAADTAAPAAQPAAAPAQVSSRDGYVRIFCTQCVTACRRVT